jgi:beta-N-acetylhexosaminidase
MSFGRAAIVLGVAAVAALVAIAAQGPAPSEVERPPVVNIAPSPPGDAVPRATAKPRIKKRLIPYPDSRRSDMAAYSKRHYGEASYTLTAPKLIVQHFAVAGSISAIYNTFAPNRPDVEYGELPGVCSHYAVGAGGGVYKFVPVNIRCRHVVGLNHVAIGIEHVGFSDGEVLGRKAEFEASLRLTHWLRCRFDIPVKGVIGHAESLSSPYYLELDPDFRGRTHSDFKRATMRIYRRELAELGACA